jgi:hypothetical protein
MWGFLIMAKNSMLEFYTQDQDQCNQWVVALRRYVVLLDLKEELVIGNLIGRGNFARVHLSYRKSGPDKGA